MAIKPLSNIHHKNLKVDTRPLEGYGVLVNRAVAHTPEFPELHKEFPLLIHKDPKSDACSAHAILGFEKDENLFVENEAWRCRAVPACFARGPFTFSQRRREENGEGVTEAVMMVDEDDPRCSKDGGADTGEQVFLELGGESPYLEDVKRALQVIEQGIPSDKLLFQTLEAQELLEPVKIQVTLNQNLQIGFSGYHTVNLERLQQLSRDELHKLHEAGFLGSVFYLISSVSNFNHLIALKNARDGGQEAVNPPAA